jgi:hypothetical protein
MPKGFMFQHMHGMISCAEFEDFIQDFLEDTLEPRQKKVFELHFAVNTVTISRSIRKRLRLGKPRLNDPMRLFHQLCQTISSKLFLTRGQPITRPRVIRSSIVTKYNWVELFYEISDDV